ncbi:hypothetical protein AB0E69_36030 [Kribbella sp. NPDC026611]|uniref:hypothetical protein n=1 Tax=Kribbella sp. NPDC026611 TaxID=3154911 RepID=UPI0033CA8CF0
MGRWTHSFEEDHDGVTVYRHENYAFPPARGRRGVEFHADGTYRQLQIGRGDAPSPGATGRWDSSGRLQGGRIVSVGADRLEIAWG